MHARILHEALPFGVLSHSARKAVAVSLRGVNGRVPVFNVLAARSVSNPSNDPFPQEQSMYRRKLAILVAASFAGLMLSSPSFAQNTVPAAGAPESRSIERADKKAAESDASRNTEMKNQSESNLPRKLGAPESRSSERADKRSVVSKKAAAAAKADYKAAVEKCDAQPATERGTCIQEAKDAQALAMNKARNGSPATSGAPESRSTGPQSAK